MDFNDVPLFVRIVDSGSLSAVASELGIQRSSVSRALARLEQALGTRLLQRTTRKLALTDAGKEFFQRARGAVAGFDEAINAVREFGGEPRGVVRMTAAPDAQRIGLAEALATFTLKYPAISIELMLTPRFVDLVGEGFDLAMRAGKLPDSSLIARKVGSTQLMLFAAPAYLKRAGEPTTYAELAQHEHVVYRGHAGRTSLRMTGPHGEETIEVNSKICVEDMGFILHACIAGAGIGLMPVELAYKAARDGSIVRVLAKYNVPGGSLHIVLPSSALVPARVALLRDHLFVHLQREMAEAQKSCTEHKKTPRKKRA